MSPKPFVFPKGYRRPKSRLRATRSPVYVPTSNPVKAEAAIWLRAGRS